MTMTTDISNTDNPGPDQAAIENIDNASATETVSDDELKRLDELALNAIKTCFDPEIPVNIYELGLIYKVIVNRDRNVRVEMTLTSPNCPAAQSLPAEVKQKVEEVDGVNETHVEIVWMPPWGPHLMSEAAKLELGFF
jgi:FeS assembly SUF system protein